MEGPLSLSLLVGAIEFLGHKAIGQEGLDLLLSRQ